jgi:hypothetical protein
MPPVANPEVPASLCSAIDWDEVAVARHALAPDAVRERVEAGQLPTTLLPITCIKGKFRPGRFVDEAGNVYRLHDVVAILDESPEARPYVAAYRHERRMEAIELASFASVVGLYVGVRAPNTAADAEYALARAVAAYDAGQFWHETEVAYTLSDPTIPASTIRATELLLADRGCPVAHDDPAFLGNAHAVLDYAGAGYDASTLMRAVDVSPVAGCDLRAVVNGGLAQAIERKVPVVEIPVDEPPAIDPPLPTLEP